jgi:hypothetical protein
MSPTLALFACLAVIPAPATRDDAAQQCVTFRAVQRGHVTSIQCSVAGLAFEANAISFQQHGRRLSVRGLYGRLECAAEDGTVIAVSKELRVPQPGLNLTHVFKDATTGEIVIHVYGANHDPKIVPLPAAEK